MAAEQTVRIDGSAPITTTVSGVVTTEPPIPANADVISGGVQVDNSTTPTTVITIPAGRTWCGSVAVCGSNADTTQSLATTSIVVTGANAIPAPATVIAQVISRRDSAATVMTHYPVYVTAPPGNVVTLQLVNSRGTTYSGVGSANGVLL
jgi:hypothetical protein